MSEDRQFDRGQSLAEQILHHVSVGEAEMQKAKAYLALPPRSRDGDRVAELHRILNDLDRRVRPNTSVAMQSLNGGLEPEVPAPSTTSLTLARNMEARDRKFALMLLCLSLIVVPATGVAVALVAYLLRASELVALTSAAFLSLAGLVNLVVLYRAYGNAFDVATRRSDMVLALAASLGPADGPGPSEPDAARR